MPEPGERRSLILLGVCSVVFLMLAIAAWTTWGPFVGRQPKFKLQAEHITVPERPEWVLDDVRVAAVRDGGLNELYVTDPALVEKVESAFGVQTWVARVNRIRKRPGPHIEVDLEYRKPIALVEVLTQQGQRALQPVDRDGYVLPERFLHANTALIKQFPRIQAGYRMPSGPVGTPWGDGQIVAAARICESLLPHWKQLGLYRVEAVSGGSAAVGGTTEFEILTQGKSRILWGRTIGHERPGEADHIAKLQALLQRASAQPIDADGPTILDLRPARTARRGVAAPR